MLAAILGTQISNLSDVVINVAQPTMIRLQAQHPMPGVEDTLVTVP